MCFLLFLRSSLCLGDSVTLRKLLSNTANFTSSWEYGYDASLSDGRIMLVPADVQMEGYAWYTSRLPSENWSAELFFSFEFDSVAKFAIWVTRDFTPGGSVFAGPEKFSGIGILFSYQSGHRLGVEIRENDGSKSYSRLNFNPDLTIELENSAMGLKIFAEQSKLRIVLAVNSVEIPIVGKQFPAVAGRPWIGVTAANQNQAFPVFLDSARVLGGKDVPELVHSPSLAILNPLQAGDLQIEDVLESFDQVLQKVELMSDQDFLTRILENSALPLSDSWQRRSLRIQKSKKFLNETVKMSLEKVEVLVLSFGRLLRHDLKEFRRDLAHVYEDIRSNLTALGENFDAPEEPRFTFDRCLIVVSFSETILAIVCFLSKIFFVRLKQVASQKIEKG